MFLPFRYLCPALLCMLFLAGCSSQSTPSADTVPVAEVRTSIGREMEHSMRSETLDKWYPQAIDKEWGGFLSGFTYDFKPADNQNKMIVTQARHTWSNAKAALMYPNVAHFKTGAAHGFAFLRESFWDAEWGGFYTLLDRQGKVLDAEKTAYGNSFGIYALTAYYQATGDTSGLNLARKAFLWLEKHSHDPIYGGYYQHLSREGKVIQRENSSPSTSDKGYKDQNSSIHLLEAFTDLYQVWPDSLLKVRLQEMLELVRDRITTEKGYMVLFFQPDWTPLSFQDSSRASIIKHRYLDHVSFGHDVETAYLMLEASHVLGLKHDERTLAVAKKMVDHALRWGWDRENGGFYDEGYYFKGQDELEITKRGKNWWAQAEGLNSLLLMADHFPDDEMQYFEKFRQLWTYCQQYLIDHEHGDWYEQGIDLEPEYKTRPKGHLWKGNYHQLRALMNCVLLLQPDAEAPSAPQNLNLERSGENVLLRWDASRDNGKMLGYNVYQGGEKIGFSPLTHFVVPLRQISNSGTFTVEAVDLHGNSSGAGKAASF